MKNDDALMMRVKEKEERKAAVLDKGWKYSITDDYHYRRHTRSCYYDEAVHECGVASCVVRFPADYCSGNIDRSSANRRARSCDSTMAGRRGVSRLEAKTDGVEGQTRPPEVVHIYDMLGTGGSV